MRRAVPAVLLVPVVGLALAPALVTVVARLVRQHRPVVPIRLTRNLTRDPAWPRLFTRPLARNRLGAAFGSGICSPLTNPDLTDSGQTTVSAPRPGPAAASGSEIPRAEARSEGPGSGELSPVTSSEESEDSARSASIGTGSASACSQASLIRSTSSAGSLNRSMAEILR